MPGARVRRVTGALLLGGTAAAWLAVGTPGVGGATFGSPPDPVTPVVAEVETSAPERPSGEVGEPAATRRAEVARDSGGTSSLAAEDAAGTEEAEVGRDAPPRFTTTAPRGAIDRTTWPIAVDIPRLAVTAPVAAVGQSSVGELIVPHSPLDVGWYQGGSVPGEPGVALLTSHVDTRTEGRGVFAGLVELAEGDTVTVTAADGTTQRWRVTARTQHLKSELPSALFARSGPPVLALVTCGGPFDREARSYRDNVIIWAEPAA